MPQLERKKIWDAITRSWHWLLAVAVTTNWIFGEFMSFDTIIWHFYLGYTILGLVLFRLLWGFIGPTPVRWTTLIPGPTEIFNYVKTITSKQPSGSAGHNPIGSLSVIAILVILLGQTGTGLFIESDDFFESAPLAGYISTALINKLTWWHFFFAKVLLVLVALHISAILFYWIWKKENLIIPMITGWKWVKK